MRMTMTQQIGVVARLVRVRGAMVLVMLIAGTASGQSSPIEREMYYVERSMTATDLFNQGKPAEALPVYEELMRGYSDFDTEGFAAMSYGDCLAQLGHGPEALAAYEEVRSRHPELAGRVDEREIEVRLAGEVDEGLIALLRSLAFGDDENSRLATLQLGRALQKQAEALLDEAAGAFRHASATDAFLPGRPFLREYATTIEGIAHDLSSLIEQMDRSSGSLRFLADLTDKGCGSIAGGREMTVRNTEASWTGVTRAGREVSYHVHRPLEGCREVTLNGETIQVTQAQWQLIEYYQERIAVTLMEAGKSSE